MISISWRRHWALFIGNKAHLPHASLHRQAFWLSSLTSGKGFRPSDSQSKIYGANEESSNCESLNGCILEIPSFRRWRCWHPVVRLFSVGAPDVFITSYLVSAALVPRNVFNELLPRQTSNTVGYHVSALCSTKQNWTRNQCTSTCAPFQTTLDVSCSFPQKLHLAQNPKNY